MTNEKNKLNDEVNLECENSKKTKTETATDVYYKTQCKLPDSEVAIPTLDAVIEAKDWVDDANKK